MTSKVFLDVSDVIGFDKQKFPLILIILYDLEYHYDEYDVGLGICISMHDACGSNYNLEPY